MTRLVLFTICWLGLFTQFNAQAAWATGKTKVGVISKLSQADFQKNLAPTFESKCTQCEIVNLTAYDSNGNALKEKIWPTLNTALDEYAIVMVDYNEKLTPENQGIAQEISKKLVGDKLLIASTGESSPGEPTWPLKKSFMGHVPQALIIGQLTERERLLPSLFYGPEMLTALRLPRDMEEKGMGAAHFFLARFLGVFKQREPQEWVSYLRNLRANHRKLWPDLGDFFGSR
ncbi:MAG: hypothetical protein V4736_02725 [Bdellovibrionota bacterium]